MSVVLMSKRELNRIDVLARLDGGRLTTAAAADLMRLTRRQTHRLLKRYRDGGAAAIANRRRGRPSNNRLSDVVRDHAIGLVREDAASGDGMTQFGRALSELNIEILCANPRFLQIECLQEELFCKKLQNRRNLSLRREYVSARMALGGAPF